MYGTIFNLKVKSGHEEQLLKTLKEHATSRPKGIVAWLVMNPDDKEEWIGVAIFDSKEAYISNANRPEQHEVFLKMMQHLETEPTWTDGTYVIGEIA